MERPASREAHRAADCVAHREASGAVAGAGGPLLFVVLSTKDLDLATLSGTPPYEVGQWSESSMVTASRERVTGGAGTGGGAGAGGATPAKGSSFTIPKGKALTAA
jgi:hypothetical protein